MSSFYRNYRPYILLFATALSLTLVFAWIPLYQDILSKSLSVISYVVWHNIFEFSGIIISICVFCVAYYSFEQNHSFRNMFLGSMLLLMAFLDFFHAMTFKGMPDFLVPYTSPNTATTFWIIARLIGGFGLLATSLIPSRLKLKIHLIIFSVLPILISLSVMYLVVYHPGQIPPMYIEGKGLTDLKITLEVVVILTYLATILIMMQEYRKTNDMNLVIFSCAILIGIFSELAFTLYTDVYGIYNYFGHLLKFVMYFIIFRVAFIQNIKQPYYELSIAKDEIKNYADNLDRIVEQRTEQINQIHQNLLDDLEYARDIQLSMLPKALPRTQKLAFEACYFPAERVSGDFYNVIKIDDTKIGMYIGDVSGHGVSAAMLTVFLSQSIKPKKENSDGTKEALLPSEVLKNLFLDFNETDFKSEVYIVLLYGIFDLSSMEFTFASAGLNVLPLIASASGEVSELEIKGFPVCKLPDSQKIKYNDSSIKLNRGDRILFYTDGLIEAENPEKEAFSESRLKTLVQSNRHLDTPHFANSISEHVFQFIGSSKLQDDITFLIAEVQ